MLLGYASAFWIDAFLESTSRKITVKGVHEQTYKNSLKLPRKTIETSF